MELTFHKKPDCVLYVLRFFFADLMRGKIGKEGIEFPHTHSLYITIRTGKIFNTRPYNVR